MLGAVSIDFVNLGLKINDMGKNINVFGFSIAYYGIIIGIGMLLAMIVVFHEAKITGQNVEYYYDYAMWLIVFSVLGARIYYVIFEWDQYKGDFMKMINIRNGGLAIYGGVLAGIITTIVYTRIKKMNFWQVADTVTLGLLIGQILGRWGNFFNREAFGGYTDNLFAMRIKYDEVGGVISKSLEENIKVVDGIKYIQVHPTFLYESLWNLGLFIIIFLFRKHKKFQGQIFAMYMVGYGIGRFWIEGLRTDQLVIKGIGVAASQVVAVGMIVVGVGFMIAKTFSLKKSEGEMKS